MKLKRKSYSLAEKEKIYFLAKPSLDDIKEWDNLPKKVRSELSRKPDQIPGAISGKRIKHTVDRSFITPKRALKEARLVNELGIEADGGRSLRKGIANIGNKVGKQFGKKNGGYKTLKLLKLIK